MARMQRPQPWHPFGHILPFAVGQFARIYASTQTTTNIQGIRSSPFAEIAVNLLFFVSISKRK